MSHLKYTREIARARLDTLRQNVRSKAKTLRDNIMATEAYAVPGQTMMAGTASTVTEAYFQAVGELAGYQSALEAAGLGDVNRDTTPPRVVRL